MFFIKKYDIIKDIIFKETNMGKIIFFTGGSRSGKSKFAEEYIYEQKSAT